jgi:hypothetical protein
MNKKDHHPIYHLGKMVDSMMLFKPASIKDYKNSHQFSCKIQVLIDDTDPNSQFIEKLRVSEY